MTSPNPPRRGPDRWTAVARGPAPGSGTTGTKET